MTRIARHQGKAHGSPKYYRHISHHALSVPVLSGVRTILLIRMCSSSLADLFCDVLFHIRTTELYVIDADEGAIASLKSKGDNPLLAAKAEGNILRLWRYPAAQVSNLAL